MTTRTRVLVAIPTFRRAGLIGALVAEIASQARASETPARIVVVDNDPERSAELETNLSGAEYIAEPTPGIAAVRQRALESAVPGELTIMVDDDVFPEPGWFDALVDAWRVYRPSAVMGHVRYAWPDGTDPWIAAGGFIRRTSYPTGTRLTTFVTGNVLIDTDAVRGLGVRFNTALGLSGGEDTQFGADLQRVGGTIVASADAICLDEIPQARATRAFVRERTISHGVLRVRTDLRGRRRTMLLAARGAALAGGITRWTVFTARLILGRLRKDLVLDATSQRRAWFAIGRINGALGRVRHEYARTNEK